MRISRGNEGKRMNEFAEWHNYADCNICRMTQRHTARGDGKYIEYARARPVRIYPSVVSGSTAFS